jgi:gluconokinase
MGVSGSGKTTLGKRLAQALGCRFIEGDELHDTASIEKMRRGEALGDADRWPWLDRLSVALRDAANLHGLAVASCSALKHQYRLRLNAGAGVPVSYIMMETSHEELAHRLSNREGHYMPASLLASQLNTLERPTTSEHALILNSCQEPDALCAASCAWLATSRR